MIRRKNTLGYLEFIRGRYSVDDINHIISLFNQMTIEEVKDIENNNFDFLWTKLWNNKNIKNSKYHILENEKSTHFFLLTGGTKG